MRSAGSGARIVGGQQRSCWRCCRCSAYPVRRLRREARAAAVDADQAWLAVVAVINTVISRYYYLRVIAPTVLESRASASPGASTVQVGKPLGAALAAAAATTVRFGVAAEPLIRLGRARHHAQRLMRSLERLGSLGDSPVINRRIMASSVTAKGRDAHRMPDGITTQGDEMP
jgi:hypothetical protein